jgi:hypothetical protein
MDALEAAQFASDLADRYQDFAVNIKNFLHDNIGKINNDEEHTLSGNLNQLLAYSNQFAALSDRIAFAGADDYFPKVNAATGQISDALNKMNTVDKIINITAGVIGLAEGILTQSGGGIVSSLQTIAQSIKS